MKSLILLALFYIVACCAEKARFDNYRVYSFEIKTKEQFDAMKYIEENSDAYNFWEDPALNARVELLVPPHKFADFKEMMQNLNIIPELYIENLQSLIKEEEEAIGKRLKRKNMPGVPTMDWTSYYSFEEIMAWLDELQAQYPQWVTVTTIGHSAEGRPIRLMKISKRANNRAIFVESTIHAREWIAPATSTYIINQLLTSNNPAVQEIANFVDWYFAPVVNPDGYVFTWTSNRNWRKTRSVVSALCFGVDGNRNFAFNWLTPDETGNEGGSRVPCSDTYAGAFPHSEPETQATEGFLQNHAHEIDAVLALHSYGHLFLHPWGHTRVPPATVNELRSVGEAGKAAIAARNGISYTVGSSNEVLYASTGTTRDHVYGAHNIPISYTVEMRGNGPYGNYGFVLPPSLILANAEEVLDGVVAMIREARNFGRFPINA